MDTTAPDQTPRQAFPPASASPRANRGSRLTDCYHTTNLSTEC